MKIKFVEEHEYTEGEQPTRLKVSVRIEEDWEGEGENCIVVQAETEDGDREDLLSINEAGTITLMHLGAYNTLNIPVSRSGKMKVSK